MSTIVESPWYEARVQTYPAGRVCRHHGCGTVLSRYNPDPFCGAHMPEPDWSYQGIYFAFCAECGELLQTTKRRFGLDHHLCSKCKTAGHPGPETPMPTALEAGTGQFRTCPRCGCVGEGGIEFRVTRHHKHGRAPKVSPTCRECERETNLDRYYLNRYGMSRVEYMKEHG